MNQMMSRMNQIMTNIVKRQGKSSIPALTLWVSPLSIYMVLLNSRASTAKNKLDRAVEVLKTSMSDAYVVSTDQLASSESVNVISETEQKASELDRLHNLMKENLTTATYSEKM